MEGGRLLKAIRSCWVAMRPYEHTPLTKILEWTGFAIAAWSLPGLAFAVFTFANLAPRAFANHKWYKEKFPDYPEERKALLPFIT